ncbi:hypothetical protein GOBAR_AA15506 [Gossypium barbadense]|uniref:Uncharacterized protein n=1 Tax=Gossypium barbadense TaxID=3634 RepID=A0A2P5XP82_GOSBA|nr:hypothetical protein GOBAR_AA15506 [Gossypium barbadense]
MANIIDVGIGELTLCVGNETITLQPRNSSNTSKIEGGCINYSTSTDHVVKPFMQETVMKNVEERVLLDAADPRITTSEPNEEIPLTVLNIFPYGTVEVNHPKFNTFKTFKRPHGQAHGRALGLVRTGQDFSPTRDAINCHGRATWLWAKLPKQHGSETRPRLEIVVETENVTRACDTPVPSTRGRHCQNKHWRIPMYTSMGEANKVRHGRAAQPCAPTRPKNTGVGRMSDAPKFKIRETHGQKLGYTGISHGHVPQNLYKPLTIHHLPPQKSLTLVATISHALPPMLVRHLQHRFRHSKATLEQIHLADAVRALLTTDSWGLLFEIIEPTYLEFTLELCLTFHLQTIMTNFNDPRTVQFLLGGLVRQLSVLEFGIALGLYTEEFMDENELKTLPRHIHYSPSKCLRDLVPASAIYYPSHSKASALPPSLRKTREHRRRHHPRCLILMEYGEWAYGAKQERGHLYRALCDSISSVLWAPQHGNTIILLHSHRQDVQGISSMLSMRMIEKRHGTYPPQYRLAQSTEKEDPEDITDDVPPRHEDPPSQPPPPLVQFMRLLHTLTSLSALLDSSSSVFSASITLMLLYSRFVSNDRETTWHIPSSVSPCPVYREGGPRGHY